ncbi:phosphatase PAP2 family protein [Streptomyces dysideae]|uniref:Phosphatidic acid phosphatase type 2/haloperoxidase domain-containing protein n=1 Tax=Streptomyces dysideae TaxID=909626 RepID=A0A101UQJ8_9ACTN|nr:phosphatase PAP2 family protein [Streptomyces dysideae]KUO15031.1 hypothetical protein AQJ91_43690 [Streptomyces dysideae]
MAVFVGVLAGSPLLEFDWRLALWRPYKQWPQLRGLLDVLVVAGQRGPTATVAVAWLGWRSWRSRNARPLLVFLTAMALLNVSVGVVKLGTGRLGPSYAHAIGSTEFFRGGDIFPSGHTANSVVIWGTLAYLASHHRRTATVAAALAAVVVGLATVYLGTHWFSDVLGGWAAGALVMLALPHCEPFVERIRVCLSALWARLGAGPGPGVVANTGVSADCGRRGRDGPGGAMATPGPSPAGAAEPGTSYRASASRQVSPAAAAVALHPRAWNERGPPRVSDKW